MNNQPRGQFNSGLGFVMAAAGSAIGLGNIWGFPTQVAQNGGAGFVLIYIILIFLVGYPLLIAEFVVGRHAKSNPVGVYQKIPGGRSFVPAGYLGLVVIGLVLSFYCIVAGKMMAYAAGSFFELLGLTFLADWVASDQITPNSLFTSLFFLLTMLIVSEGISEGIEKWSRRLMPLLLLLLLIMTGYVLTLEGAMDGVRAYLFPDFSKVFSPKLLISAMGQAFFSLSLGVGGMMVLASYTSSKENLIRLGLWVTLADLFIAFMAGLLIIPAMYVAAERGTQIVDGNGILSSGSDLIFRVLPQLFETLGFWGTLFALIFFVLMTLAAITSSISMMEVPTAYLVDNRKLPRKNAARFTAVVFWLVSMVITLNIDWLFDLMVVITTQYGQPLLGIIVCIYVGWVVNNNTIRAELSRGAPRIGLTNFIPVWRLFIRVISPALILLILGQFLLQ